MSSLSGIFSFNWLFIGNYSCIACIAQAEAFIVHWVWFSPSLRLPRLGNAIHKNSNWITYFIYACTMNVYVRLCMYFLKCWAINLHKLITRTRTGSRTGTRTGARTCALSKHEPELNWILLAKSHSFRRPQSWWNQTQMPPCRIRNTRVKEQNTKRTTNNFAAAWNWPWLGGKQARKKGKAHS